MTGTTELQAIADRVVAMARPGEHIEAFVARFLAPQRARQGAEAEGEQREGHQGEREEQPDEELAEGHRPEAAVGAEQVADALLALDRDALKRRGKAEREQR